MGYCISHSLAGLGRDCENNIGGIRKAFVAHFPSAGTMYTIDASADTISAITTGTSIWYEYTFNKETGSFTSNLTIDAPNGINYVSTDINFVFTRMENQKRMELKAMALDDLCVVVVDSNNQYWAFGIEEPVNVKAGTGETGIAKGDGNKYSITLTDSYKTWPVTLTAAAIEALENSAVR